MKKLLTIAGLAMVACGVAYAGAGTVGNGGLSGPAGTGSTTSIVDFDGGAISPLSVTTPFVDAGIVCIGGTNPGCWVPNVTVSSFTGLIWNGNFGTRGAGDIACTTQSGSACTISARNSAGGVASSMSSNGDIVIASNATFSNTGAVAGAAAFNTSAGLYRSQAASGNKAFEATVEGARWYIGPDTYLYEAGTSVQITTGTGGVDISGGRITSRNATGGFSFGTAGTEYLGMAAGANTITVGGGATLTIGSGQGTSESLKVGGRLAAANNAPTISSGFGSSPSIAANNGTWAFTVNVGTGGTASSGVIGLPTATTAWVCNCDDLAAAVSVTETRQSATSTTSCTVSNVNTATGVAAAWAASEVLYCIAHPI